MIAFAKPLIMILDDAYAEAWLYAPFMIIGAVFFALSGFVCVNYSVCERTSGVLITSVIGGVCSVVLSLILIPKLGLQGASLTYMISFYVLWLAMAVHTEKLLDIRHDYLRVHISLLIVASESLAVIRQCSPLVTVVCILLLLAVNRDALKGLLSGTVRLTDKEL